MPAPLDIWIPERVAHRAYAKWNRGQNGCRISTYSTGSHGYGQIGWSENGVMRGTTVHRAAWAHVHGQIPKGMTVDHKPTCDRRCVNVRHLRLLTNFENGRRTQGRDWPLGECINGHPNSELVVTDGGRRIRCRICNQKQKREYAQRNTDKRREIQRAYRKRKKELSQMTQSRTTKHQEGQEQ